MVQGFKITLSLLLVTIAIVFWSSLPSSGTRGLPGNWRPLSFSDRGRKLQLEVRFYFNLKTSYWDHLDLMDLTLALTWKFRFIFPFDYLAAEEKIVISKKESLFRWTNIFQKTNQEIKTYPFLHLLHLTSIHCTKYHCLVTRNYSKMLRFSTKKLFPTSPQLGREHQ